MHKNKDEIKIGISKTKASLQIIIAFGLFGATIWFLINNVLFLTPAFNKTFLLICCFILILAFGSGIISGVRKILNLDTGIIVNKNGIKINIGPNSGQLIKWDNIKEFKIHNPINGPTFLLIFVKNPEEFISKTYGLKKIFIKINNIFHGTPISLTSNWLEYDFEKLIGLINDEYNKYIAQH